MEPWLLGTIPWSAGEMIDVMAFEQKLLATPKDDWNLDKRHVIDFAGQFHPVDEFHPGQQLIGFLLEKYAGNTDLVRAHAFRYALAKEFFKDYRARLEQEGIVKGEGKNLAMSAGLMHAICSSQFLEECTRRGKPSRRLKFTGIVQLARNLDKE
jgi:hypothetical protein